MTPFVSTQLVRASIAAALAALAAACAAPAGQAPAGPFTPGVQVFVDTYLQYGSEKLTNWVQGTDLAPRRRAARVHHGRGPPIDLVASEPVVRLRLFI